ncbi:MAG: hypothetical protein JJT96_19590 [Opitutales bacterium]|nr:hypothetical protein [Opitutales bacterium]
MNEPSLSINPAEIENNSGRERFGFGLLPQVPGGFGSVFPGLRCAQEGEGEGGYLSASQ